MHKSITYLVKTRIHFDLVCFVYCRTYLIARFIPNLKKRGMQSDFEMGGGGRIRNQQPQPQQQRFIVENASPFFPINPHYPHHPLLQEIHALPFTPQFFQNQHHRSIIENQEIEGGGEAPFFPLSFKHKCLYGNEEEERERGGQEDALLRGSERYCPDPCWQNQEDSAIKQPFWKPEFPNENNNSEKKQHEDIDHPQMVEENKSCGAAVFGELEEAIYATKPDTTIRRIASESVLTADEDFPMNNTTTTPRSATVSVGGTSEGVKRKRKSKQGMSDDSMARFFESLVKKLVKQQEGLQRRLMETIERLDEERKEREEAWREQELAKLQKEAAARAHERTLASTREAALVSCLEKLTGQNINFHDKSMANKQC